MGRHAQILGVGEPEIRNPTPHRGGVGKFCSPLPSEWERGWGRAACTVEPILLDIGSRAGLDQLGLGGIGLFLADGFLDWLGRCLDQIFGLLQA